MPLTMRKKLAQINRLLQRKFPKEGYEFQLAPFMKVPDGTCFIDIGAHIGLHTLTMARQNIPVYAFEPSPKTYKKLTENTRMLPKITTLNYALGHKNTEATLYIHGSGFDSLRNIYGKNIKEINVTVKTLDSLNIAQIGLIKIDTEGNEYNILKGAMKTLKREKPRLIIELHSPIYQNKQLITQLLSTLGYKRFRQLHSASQLFMIVDWS